MLMDRQVSYYLLFKADKKENKKIHKFTRKRLTDFEKVIKKLKKRLEKSTAKFVRKNKGNYINKHFGQYLVNAYIEYLSDDNSPFVYSDYCRPREIASIGEKGLCFSCDMLPNGLCPNNWLELKLYLLGLKHKSFVIVDSDKHTYSLTEFINVIEEQL